MLEQEKVCAAVRIIPLSYGNNSNCDHHVISRRHMSFQTSMFLSRLNEITRIIEAKYGDGVTVTQTAYSEEVMLSIAYRPEYFDCFNDPQPFQNFLQWIENMWWNALSDYRRTMLINHSRC